MIAAIDAYNAFKRAVSTLAGASVEGLLPKTAQHFINLGIIDLELDAIAGSSTLNPLKIDIIKKALGTSSQTLEQKDFLIGTPNNGALRLLDRDYQDIGNVTSDKFATLISIPKEVLAVSSRILDIQLGSNKPRTMIQCVPVTLEYYSMNITDDETTPNIHLAWAYEQVGNTPAVPEEGLEESSLGITGITYGVDGDGLDDLGNGSGVEVSYSGNIHQIICPKGYRPIAYTIFYYKHSTPIVIDKLLQFHVDSDMPAELLPDVVARARKFYVASLAATPQGYQIADNETKD